jgi:5-methylcytosine-specific restriction endonuclease McrA
MAAKKCSKCGEEKPLDQFYKFKLGKFGRQAECKACSDARRRALAKKRPDQERESRRLWAEKNKDKVATSRAKFKASESGQKWMRDYFARWYRENRERLKPIRRAWYLANKEEHNARSMASYYANTEVWREYQKRWARENREKMRLYTSVSDAKRRAAKLNSSGQFTARDIELLFQMQRGRCAVCRASIKDGFHRDHIDPLSNGGSNDKHNIQLLCPPCNQHKHAKDPIAFMQARGYLL